ncbi:hypothetical protein ACG04R_16465 [Roseateles sp. BYS78W]|uniref:Uncharacterized protein n=1 Tax=Pelomonas candidula TaxID=3299025 RepID=A0ABW7HED6_9BURK
MNNTSPSYAELLRRFGDYPMMVHGLSRGCHALAALMWQEENLEVLRSVEMPAMMLLAAEVDIGLEWLEGKTAAASAVPDDTGYSERDILTEALVGVRALKRDVEQLLTHMATGAGEHLADTWMRQRDERLAAEAGETALWAGFEQLREFAREAARFEDGAQIWHVLNALVEVGVPMHLLGPSVAPTIYCHIVEPNSSLGTDTDADLVDVLNFIGLPYRYNEKGDELILESDGDGWDFKKGQPEGAFGHPGLDGWRQVPTSSVDEVHLALLACTDRYWERLPVRLRTPRFILEALPRLFHVATVADIPRPSIREAALSLLADQACPSSSVPARMH